MNSQFDMFGTTAPASDAERRLRSELHKTRDELRKLRLIAPKNCPDGWDEVERLRRDNCGLQARIDDLWAKLQTGVAVGQVLTETALEAQRLRAKLLIANATITQTECRGTILWRRAAQRIEEFENDAHHYADCWAQARENHGRDVIRMEALRVELKSALGRLERYTEQEDARTEAMRALEEGRERLHQEGLAREEAMRKRIQELESQIRRVS